MPITAIVLPLASWQPLEEPLQTPGIPGSMIRKPLDLTANKTG